MHMINWFVIHVSGAKGDDFTYLTKTQMSDKKLAGKCPMGRLREVGKKKRKKKVSLLCAAGAQESPQELV